MEENSINFGKSQSVPIEERRRTEEYSALITDKNGLKEYSESFGVDFTKMEGQKVLDIGSGKSEKFSKEAAKIGVRVFSMSTAGDLRYHGKSAEFLKDWQGRTVVGRVQQMPFTDNTFDYEVALNSVPYYLPLEENEYRMFFSEVIRTLKSGGRAYISPIFGDNLRGGIISREFVTTVLGEFSDRCTFVIDESPNSGDQEGKEYRLVLTKK